MRPYFFYTFILLYQKKALPLSRFFQHNLGILEKQLDRVRSDTRPIFVMSTLQFGIKNAKK